MKQIRKWQVGAALAALVATGLVLGPAQATTNTATSKQLAMATIPRTILHGHGVTASGDRWGALLATHGLTDAYVIDNTFQPGQTTGWHQHLGPSLIFVVAGSITDYDTSVHHCKGVTYTKGQSFVDSGGADIHTLVNNGTEVAETIAVQFIPNGQPRRIDVPTVPPSCQG